LNPSQLISGGITKAPLHSALRERLPRLTKGIKAKGDGAVGWHGMERREGKGREGKRREGKRREGFYPVDVKIRHRAHLKSKITIWFWINFFGRVSAR
jgi:hypothetical protein